MKRGKTKSRMHAVLMNSILDEKREKSKVSWRTTRATQ